MTKAFAYIMAIIIAVGMFASLPVAAEEDGVYYANVIDFTAVYDKYAEQVEFCAVFDGAVLQQAEFYVRIYCIVFDPYYEEWLDDQSINTYVLAFEDHLTDGNKLKGMLPLGSDIFYSEYYRDFRICISGALISDEGTRYYSLDSADIPIAPKDEHTGQSVGFDVQLLPQATAVGGYVMLKLSVTDINSSLSNGLTSLSFDLGYNQELLRLEGVFIEADGADWSFEHSFNADGIGLVLNGGGVTEDGGLTVSFKFMTLALGQGGFTLTNISGGDGYGHSFFVDELILDASLDVSGTPVLIGDVNSDGLVDNLDAAWILKYDASLMAEISNGDVNNDGLTDSLDAALILKFDAGMIDSF